MSLYADSSAILKRYVDEADSEVADALLRADRTVLTARHTIVEVRRNLARLLTGRDLTAARAAFADDLASIIELDVVTCESAASIAEVFGVQTLDALHLGAAVTWSRRSADSDVVASADGDVVASAERRPCPSVISPTGCGLCGCLRNRPTSDAPSTLGVATVGRHTRYQSADLTAPMAGRLHNQQPVTRMTGSREPHRGIGACPGGWTERADRASGSSGRSDRASGLGGRIGLLVVTA